MTTQPTGFDGRFAGSSSSAKFIDPRLLQSRIVCACSLTLFLVLSIDFPQPASGTESLVLESTIALPDTPGRIDHMSVDLLRKRLFVAELGNDSVDVVDLGSEKVIRRISGLDEPQGVAYVATTDRLLIADGGDGLLKIYDGKTFELHKVINLGEDADNIRLGPAPSQSTIGYGNGALAIIDTAAATKIGDIKLSGHPEAFAFEAASDRVFVNVPDADQIAVVDLKRMRQVAHWSPPGLSDNYPMAAGSDNAIVTVFRGQSKVVAFETSNGNMIATTDTCRDADDIYFDAKRKLYYVSCGEGFVDVFAAPRLGRIARIPTSSGARTSLFVPELDRFYVAVRAGLLFGSRASILVFRPTFQGAPQ